ncbi:MAG: outer membrane protein assembly factor BamA [Pseudomonadota bacterium]|nr:outer membrane protein assembly factor BamA [Pseudomonadota bacterium]
MLLVGTVLGGWGVPLLAQEAAPTAPAQAATTAAAPATAPAANSGTIRSISVSGAERLEPETIRSYANLSPGQTYTAETLDTALKDLYATELFADVQFLGADTGAIVIQVRENPVINRIVLEGNKRIKDDKIQPEIRLAPRQIFTRSKVRADVDRIIELYKRQGRFAATVEPKIVQLDQNRVDLVFEITEGDKSKVRAINIIGNEQFGDGTLQKEMYTKEAGGVLGFFKSNDSYDPDRLAADQQKLRAFYLTQGYADFRVVSALAELTPDRRDFVITYVVEEGPRYKFGTVEAASDLRDLTSKQITESLKIKPGDWFNAKQVEDTVTGLTEVAGIKGYAFAEISPRYNRDAEKRLMNIVIEVGESQRAYVERIDIQGNTRTRDKVIRREFRVNEGDAFNTNLVKRSQDRIQSLGFFQDKMEVKQSPGSTPDQVVLGVDVEEKATGELQLSAGYSSLERLVLSASLAERNFLGKGQTASAGLNWSRYSRSAQLGFTEPYLFDKAILLGGDIYRRDYNSFNETSDGDRETTYSQTSTGAGLRLGFPISEYLSFGTRYGIVSDKITLSERNFFSDPDGSTGPLGLQCDPALAGPTLCDEIGRRLTSSISYNLIFDNTNGIRATRGQRLTLGQDFAGLGGDVKYLRTRLDATKYFQLPAGFVFSAHAEGGYIHALQDSPGPGRDAIRITDRFFGAQMRGFDVRGIGPRVRRTPFGDNEGLLTDDAQDSDALGGRAYYMGRAELEFPLSSKLRSLGLRPSAFIDVGSLFGLKKPTLANFLGACSGVVNLTTGVAPPTVPITPGLDCASLTPDIANDYTRFNGYQESFVGNSAKPRLSIGIGVNWISPFGPLRIDLAKALLKQDGDETKLFSFNVGTQF